MLGAGSWLLVWWRGFAPPFRGEAPGFLCGGGPSPRWRGQSPVPTRSLAPPLQCPLQRLVERGPGFFIIRGRDLALFFFYLELEQLFFQRFKQHRRSCDRYAGRGRRRGWTEGCTGVA